MSLTHTFSLSASARCAIFHERIVERAWTRLLEAKIAISLRLCWTDSRKSFASLASLETSYAVSRFRIALAASRAASFAFAACIQAIKLKTTPRILAAVPAIVQTEFQSFAVISDIFRDTDTGILRLIQLGRNDAARALGLLSPKNPHPLRHPFQRLQRLVQLFLRMLAGKHQPYPRLALRHCRKRNPRSHHALLEQRP